MKTLESNTTTQWPERPEIHTVECGWIPNTIRYRQYKVLTTHKTVVINNDSLIALIATADHLKERRQGMLKHDRG